MTTLIAYVPKSSQEKWVAGYEKLTDGVVPGCTK